MKKNRVAIVVSLVAIVLQIFIEGITLGYLVNLDMLPQKYILVFLVLFGALVAITAILMFLRGRRPVGLTRRIIAWILALVTICGCVVLCTVIGQLRQTLNAITNQTVSADTRGVYVLVDDPAQSLLDAVDYQFGIVSGYDVECTEKALDAIERETGAAVQTVAYDSVFAMIDAMYGGRNMAVILNESYIAILEEYPGYSDFDEKARLLFQAVLEVPQPEPPTTELPVEPAPVQPSVTNTPFVMYLSGSDTRSKLLTRSRSDVNILVVVNPATKQVLLLNTPRDYYVANPAGGGKMDKLTHCGIYGIDCSIEALEKLYGISVDYYAQINFSGFETLIDAIGGVTVVSDAAFKASGLWVNKGENHFNGKDALRFARERYHVAGGDNGRGKNQMKIITAVIQKMTTGTSIVSNYSKILDSLEGMFVTDFSLEDVSRLVKMQLEEMPSWEVFSFAVTGRTGSDVNYSMPGLKASVMYQDEKLVGHASALVNRVINGDVLTEDDMTAPE